MGKILSKRLPLNSAESSSPRDLGERRGEKKKFDFDDRTPPPYNPSYEDDEEESTFQRDVRERSSIIERSVNKRYFGSEFTPELSSKSGPRKIKHDNMFEADNESVISSASQEMESETKEGIEISSYAIAFTMMSTKTISSIIGVAVANESPLCPYCSIQLAMMLQTGGRVTVDDEGEKITVENSVAIEVCNECIGNFDNGFTIKSPIKMKGIHKNITDWNKIEPVDSTSEYIKNRSEFLLSEIGDSVDAVISIYLKAVKSKKVKPMKSVFGRNRKKALDALCCFAKYQYLEVLTDMINQ